MIFTLPKDLDAETLEELIISIQDALDELEPALEHLAAYPDDKNLLNDLFRNLHTIKGNFRMCLLSPFTDYVHGIEESISEVRKGRLSFNSLLTETCILALDKLRYHLDILQQQAACETDEMAAIGSRFLAIALADNSYAAEQLIAQLLLDLRSGAIDTSANTITVVLAPESEQDIRQQQLQFFKATSEKLALKLNGNSQLYQQMVQIAEAALPHLPSDIDSPQLVAAIYLHDIGMAVLDGATQPVPTDNTQILAKHPLAAYQYLLKHPGWQTAAEICLQHHENWDGSGYPKQLKGEQIHCAAQFIAALDLFCEQLTLHSHSPPCRASLNALIACNRELGRCFSLTVVRALNLAVKQLYLSQALPPAYAA